MSALHEALRRAERMALEHWMDEHGWNVSGAARAGGIARVSLYKLMRRLGVSPAARRSGRLSAAAEGLG